MGSMEDLNDNLTKMLEKSESITDLIEVLDQTIQRSMG